MKATIDFDDALYRRLKVEAARRGRTIRDLVAEGVRQVLDLPANEGAPSADAPTAWFGSLRSHARNARGVHDLDAMRRSIARGRGSSG
jgi:plasmid stability protein